MTIPAECAVKPPPCCDHSYTVAEQLGDLVTAALVACQTPELCDDIKTFVSHGEPIGWAHFVAVWLVRERYARSALGVGQPIRTYGIRYLEPGFPMPQAGHGGKLVLPARELLDGASMYSYAHKDAIIQALVGSVANGTIAGCDTVTIDEVAPAPLVQGYGGWTVTATWSRF